VPELMGRVYRIFRRELWDDPELTKTQKEDIMFWLREAIRKAQGEVYKEVIKVES